MAAFTCELLNATLSTMPMNSTEPTRGGGGRSECEVQSHSLIRVTYTSPCKYAVVKEVQSNSSKFISPHALMQILAVQ